MLLINTAPMDLPSAAKQLADDASLVGVRALWLCAVKHCTFSQPNLRHLIKALKLADQLIAVRCERLLQIGRLLLHWQLKLHRLLIARLRSHWWW